MFVVCVDYRIFVILTFLVYAVAITV